MRTDRQTERQTDRTKLIVAFRNFENAPKNWATQPTILTSRLGGLPSSRRNTYSKAFKIQSKSKGKVHLITGHEGPKGE